MTHPAATVGTTPAVPVSGPPVLFMRPGGAGNRARQKGVADAATEDADNPHDDAERSDPMSGERKPIGAAAMLSIAQTVTRCEAGMAELGALIFGRKKQREKQRT